jgi:hypothetical protein
MVVAMFATDAIARENNYRDALVERGQDRSGSGMGNHQACPCYDLGVLVTNERPNALEV